MTETRQPGAAMTAALPETGMVDDPNRSRFRFGLGAQLNVILAGSIMLLLAASLIANLSFREILDHGARIADYSMPNLMDSEEIAQRSATVVNGAFRLAAASSKDEHGAAVAAIRKERAELEEIIGNMEARTTFRGQIQLIRTRLEELVRHLEAIQSSTARRLAIEQALAPLRDDLAETNRRIEQLLAQAIDDQGFYLVEGLRQLDQPRHALERRATEEELSTYRFLVTVNHQANLNVLLLDEILVLTDREYLPPLEERLQSAMRNALSAYRKLPDSMRNPQLGEHLQQLTGIGAAPDGIIALRKEALLRAEQEQAALVEARGTSELLSAEIGTLVGQINEDAINSSAAAQAAAAAGSRQLILLNIFSVIGAVLFGWLFVWRYLRQRLVGLSEAMRKMADGDLEVPVELGGDDEVTDMASALEVFRRYALEVQRLNLVEKLAQELDSKNETLSQALDDLQRAQQQIIAEEKLASLGQLTAGVAHEIKNPLNFIDNFSGIAKEFADEMEELITEEGDDSELSEEIKSILQEQRVSLDKIHEHSQRADSIVRNMLDHARRDAGDWREADLNALMKQYVELAYHSLRAESPTFNMKIKEALDPDVGELKVIPQDMSRVFLNLATNACQALDEKLQQIDDPDFEPELLISSKRLSDSAQFSIRDNGTGISEELREQVFQPFVTTKDGAKGTGLGLSLTSDILARHGGSIALDSEVGSYTEMRITLPLQPPAQTAGAEEDD